MGCQIQGGPLFKTRFRISCCSCAYWMLVFSRVLVFQYKSFTLSKIQRRGGYLNASKNMKLLTRKFVSEGLQQLTCQNWPAAVRIRGFPGDKFFSICPLGSFYTFLQCPHWMQDRIWPCVYLVTQSVLQLSTTQCLLCRGSHKSPFSGLCTPVCWVSDLGRRYSASHQWGKMLCATRSAGIQNYWYSILTSWRAVYAHTYWQQYHSGGCLLQTGFCWKVEGALRLGKVRDNALQLYSSVIAKARQTRSLAKRKHISKSWSLLSVSCVCVSRVSHCRMIRRLKDG